MTFKRIVFCFSISTIFCFNSLSMQPRKIAAKVFPPLVVSVEHSGRALRTPVISPNTSAASLMDAQQEDAARHIAEALETYGSSIEEADSQRSSRAVSPLLVNAEHSGRLLRAPVASPNTSSASLRSARENEDSTKLISTESSRVYSRPGSPVEEADVQQSGQLTERALPPSLTVDVEHSGRSLRMPVTSPTNTSSASLKRARQMSLSEETVKEISVALKAYSRPGSPTEKDEDEEEVCPPIKEIVSMLDMRQSFAIRNTKVILSIDGGGTRGIIPLYYIKALEEAVNHPLRVDMIAGTSVGALVGAAVALNKTTEISGHKFQEFVNSIFRKNWFSWWGMWKPVYSCDGRFNKITELTGDMSGRDLGVDFIAPFYSLLTRETKIYKNFGDSEDFRLADVLMMTSAAPTYFDPHRCDSLAGRRYEGIDGGIFANHPGLIAYHEAREKYPDSRIIMISLGTGRHNSYSDENQSSNRGLIYWGSTFPDITIDATSFNSHERLAVLSEIDINFTYIRIQPSLEKAYMLTDGVNPAHLRRLDALARSSIGVGGSERAKFLAAVEAIQQQDQRLKFQPQPL